jgi:tRNA modification GTPase
VTASEPPTLAACLTPPGQSALATIGLHGPHAWAALRKLFRPRSGHELPDLPVAGHFWLGRLGGEVADDVVVAVKRTEPAPLLEVHAHGGREIVRFLLDHLREQGLQIGSWRDFLRMTGSDALSAAAAIALAQTSTLRTAGILLDQQQGALARALEAIRTVLERGDAIEAGERLARLTRYVAVGQRLTRPFRVAVAGAPNVGKSSLVNTLAGYERSIVAPTPGTTRDVVTTRIALDGWFIELADTAGLRTRAGALEEEGIERARRAAAEADLCLWVLDGSVPPVWPDDRNAAFLYLINKSDLPSAWEAENEAGMVRVSARTGAGLAELCSAIIARLVPDPPPPGAGVAFTPHLAQKIGEAQRALIGGDAAEARRIVASVILAPEGPGE